MKSWLRCTAQVRLRDDAGGRPFIRTAALPPDEQIEANGSLSRAYLVAALLGARASEDIEWPCAGGLRRAHIEQVLFRQKFLRVSHESAAIRSKQGLKPDCLTSATRGEGASAWGIDRTDHAPENASRAFSVIAATAGFLILRSTDIA